jgi:hypothetical protein
MNDTPFSAKPQNHKDLKSALPPAVVGVPPIIYLAYLTQVSRPVPSRYPVTVYLSRAPTTAFHLHLFKDYK